MVAKAEDEALFFGEKFTHTPYQPTTPQDAAMHILSALGENDRGCPRLNTADTSQMMSATASVELQLLMVASKTTYRGQFSDYESDAGRLGKQLKDEGWKISALQIVPYRSRFATKWPFPLGAPLPKREL